jgi:WD40 repeat protein
MIRRFGGHRDWVRAVVFSVDGQKALSGSADNTLILWDVTTGQPIRHFEGHTAQVQSVALSQDGRWALSGSSDTSLILWDIASGTEVRRFLGYGNVIWSVVFSHDGQTALTGSGDGNVHQWQLSPTLADLIAWAKATRYVRDLTCPERAQYRVTPLCEDDQ